MANKAYRYRLYPDKEQTEQIIKTVGCCRYIYNTFLDRRISAYRDTRKMPGCGSLCRELVSLKKELPWLKEADSIALQQSVRDLDAAYENFFAGRARFPRFKSKHRSRQSYRTVCVNGNVRVEDDCVILPKLGRVRAAVSAAAAGCSLPWAGRPEQAAAEGTQQAQEADTGDSGKLIAQGEGEIWDDTDLYTDTEGEDGYEENISPDGTPVLPGEYTTGDCVKLCAIDGLEVTVPQKPEPEWEDAVVSAKFSMDAKPRSEDWAIEKGDMVSADITAFIDGEKDEYLSRRDAQIFVGGDGSVKEFDDALIGARKGSNVEASVTYVEDHLYMDLGGKTVVYKIHVNAVNSADTPDDETVEKELETLRKINAQVNEELLVQAVKAAIRDASEYTAYPEKMVRQARAEYERRYLAGYSSIEDYLNEVGMTRAEFKKIEDEYAAARVRDRLLLKALEEETGITADSPKFNAYTEEHGINNDDIGETQFKAICGDIKDRLNITVTEAEE